MSTTKESEIKFIKCKRCGHEYYETWSHCPNCRTPRGKNPNKVFIWILPIAIILAFLIINPINSLDFFKSSTASDLSNSINSDLQDDQNNESIALNPVTPPPTGIYQNYSDQALISPFEIRNHTDDFNYLLKFNDDNTNSTVFSVFLNANEDCNIKIPLGNYIIAFARGKGWYGDENLFGESTEYMKYVQLISFYQEGSYIQGNYIDMTPSSTGNLETDYISEDDFNK